MLSRGFFQAVLGILGLIFLQAFLFGNISFMGWISPMVYVLFLVLWPARGNRYLFLFSCFILGLGIDFFERTGGIHAFCLVLCAFIRPILWQNLAASGNYDRESFSFSRISLGSYALFALLLTFLHHTTFFLVQDLSLEQPLHLLKNIGVSTLFTFLFVVLYLSFSHKRVS